jgi:ketosteroid isomerase-like protein
MWFTETPWPPMLIGVIVAFILFLGWTSQRRTVYLLGAIGCLLGCVAIYLVEEAIVTESEAVEQLVLDLADAVERDDADAALSHFGSSLSSIGYRTAVAGAMAAYDIQDDMRITDLHVRMEDDGQTAVSHFRANATIAAKTGSMQHYGPTRWELTWKRDAAGEWKITDVQRLNPITGEAIGFLDRSTH